MVVLGQAAGQRIELPASHDRRVALHVKGFLLMGIELDGACSPAEEAILAEMPGTTIDPAVLRAASSVDEALEALAINTGNGVCARLQAYRMAPPPPTLESLPATVLEQILCAGGSLQAASHLAACSTALRAVAAADCCGGALPVEDKPAFWDATLVSWDEATRTLRRTPRPGYAQVVFAQRLGRSAVLELELLTAPPAGLAFGVLQERPGALAMKRVEFQSHGAVARVNRSHTELCRYGSRRLRAGDVVGCCFDAATRRVAWTIGGRRVGEAVELLEGRSTCLAFFVRMDSTSWPTQAVRLVPAAARRVPLDLVAMQQRQQPPSSYGHEQPCASEEAQAVEAEAEAEAEAEGALLVREIGPSGRSWYLDLPQTCGLDEVRRAVAPLIGHGVGDVQLLRGSGRPLEALDELEWQGGRPLHALYVNVPHIIS